MDLLSQVKRILGFTGGGVHKRIDENRELLELLQREAPGFLASHSWVEGWLASNDEFFVSLASNVPLTEGQFLGKAQRRPGDFHRPWPGKNHVLVATATDVSSLGNKNLDAETIIGNCSTRVWFKSNDPHVNRVDRNNV